MDEKDEIIYSRFLKKRNEADLRILLERHREGLFFFIYGYVHNMEDAEEIMMDSFALVAAGRTLFSGRSSFKTWLYAVARNKARMHMRRRRHDAVSIDDVGEDCIRSEENPEGLFLKNEQKLELYKAMEKLDDGSRHILYLIYFEDMSYNEVAHIIGKTRKQTYKLAELSREKLRKIIRKRWYI